MAPVRLPYKAQNWKQRLLEASLECIWIPARALFSLWIRFTPSYKIPLGETPDSRAELFPGSAPTETTGKAGQ